MSIEHTQKIDIDLKQAISDLTLEEKIKLYLDIYVGGKLGHTLLDTAKEILFFDMGMDAKYEQE